MMWLTWRQFRTQALVVFAAVGLLAVAHVVTRPGIASLQRESPSEFLDRFPTEGSNVVLYFVGAAVVYAVPAVIGAFWGASLIARELEAGTHRLAWTQTVTRNRWLSTKLGVTGLAALVAGAISLLVTWWCGPLDSTVNQSEPDGGVFRITRLSGLLLGARGIVPIGYAVPAFVIGVTAGLLVRRTLAAMAITLVAVLSVQVLMPVLVQPHLLPAEHSTVRITPDNLRGLFLEDDGSVQDIRVRVGVPGAWVTTNHTVDASGTEVGSISKSQADCTPEAIGERTSAGPTTLCFQQLAAAGYRQEVEWQPASRYWPLQWIQTGILLGVAALLTGFCFWRIRRDLA